MIAVAFDPEHPESARLRLDGEADTVRLAEGLAEQARPGDVVGLVGTLGAGKTRFSRAFAESLGADPGEIASPTFVLIHEYETDSLPVFHFDTYRLTDADAFDALGASDYWSDGGGVCLVEWADRVLDRLPPETWWVEIRHDPDPDRPSGRVVEVRHADPGRLASLIDRLGRG